MVRLVLRLLGPLLSLFERIGLGKMVNAWKASGAFMPHLKRITEAVGAEAITEFVQTYPEKLMDIWARTEGKSDVERLGMFYDELGQTTKEAAYQGLVGGVVGGTGASVGAAVTEAQQQVNKRNAPDLKEFGFSQQFTDNVNAGTLETNENSVNDLLRLKQSPQLMEHLQVDEVAVNDLIVGQFASEPEAQSAVATALESGASPEFISGIAEGLGINTKSAQGTEFLYQEDPRSEALAKNQAQADLRRAFQNNQMNVADLMRLRQSEQTMQQFNLDGPSVDAVIMEHFEDTHGIKPAVQMGLDLGLDPEIVSRFGEGQVAPTPKVTPVQMNDKTEPAKTMQPVEMVKDADYEFAVQFVNYR